MRMEWPISFCTSPDGTRIAYSMIGEGPAFVFVGGWVSMTYQSELFKSLAESIARRRRFIVFDRRGMGASQRDASDFSLDAHVADLAAVVERVGGGGSVDLMSFQDGCLAAIAFAAQYPERVSRMVLWQGYANGKAFTTPEAFEAMSGLIRGAPGLAYRTIAEMTYHSGPLERSQWLRRAFRDAMTPEVLHEYLKLIWTGDVTDLAPRVTAPTLVLHRRGSRNVPVDAARTLAALLPNASLTLLEGDVSDPAWQYEAYLPIVFDFLDGAEGSRRTRSPSADVAAGTAVILFADIADSTALTERLGDVAFREKARELDDALRRAIVDAGGMAVEGKLLGDGVLAVFDSARAAIDGALRCAEAGDGRGLPLHLGVHAGDVIRDRGNIYGGAVNIAARVSDAAAPGEVLVSDIVRGLARTSAGMSFEDRGDHDLKGIADPVRLYAVRPHGG
jgi:class 3 adenylate cyclase